MTFHLIILSLYLIIDFLFDNYDYLIISMNCLIMIFYVIVLTVFHIQLYFIVYIMETSLLFFNCDFYFVAEPEEMLQISPADTLMFFTRRNQELECPIKQGKCNAFILYLFYSVLFYYPSP